MRLRRHIEYEARRTGPCRHGRLEVLYIGIEGRHIQRHRALEEAELAADLVVLASLVLPVALAAELNLVLRGAQRQIDGVVDAAETEALRHLCIELSILVELEAQNSARRHAVGVDLARHAARRRGCREYAIEDQNAV